MRLLNNSNILPRVLIFYMLFALLWWAILLFKKNKNETELKLENLQLESNIVHKVNNFNIMSLPDYEEIMARHSRQQYMIIGEGLVFAFTLIIGMTLINRAHQKEVASKNQQSNFLLSITHELRSPLAAIGLILETIKKRKLSAEKIQDLSQNALEESNRLEKQINNILLAAKLDKSYLFNFREENVVSLLDKITTKYKRRFPEAQIIFNSNLNSCYLSIDLESFQSIINNLIENALKYSREQPFINIHLAQNNNMAIIEISDQGVGIPEEEKTNVFKQFYRIGSEDTRDTKGTGLGLYIVDKLVRAHNGKISITDNQPKGSKFTINIPIHI